MALKLAYVLLASLIAVIRAEQDFSIQWHRHKHLTIDTGDLKPDIAAIVTRLTEEIQRLKTKVSTLESLEARVTELEKRLAQRNTRSEDIIDGVNKASEGNNHVIETRQDKQRPHISDPETTVHRRKGIRQTPQWVAFSAVVSRPLAHLQRWQIIKFDKALENAGDGYNATSGMFTTPTSGTYIFFYHVGHYGEGETWVEIMKNGASLNGLALKGTAFDQYLQGGNSVVVQMTAGDQVWVESYHVPDASVQGRFTTFSGVLLTSK